ncbi:hypothetical protein [uncultured Arthrobacter sp.]|uniref:hypothetical protein n=1 Tax=uncultured Arthrobacter sp. TaxID=114050 RepID=UPI0025E1D504|nr:hypothetical protein [uncultured Arthrobacter sp.]
MIEVIVPDHEDTWKFDDVTKWHVDNLGHLHLQYPTGRGNAATFAPGAWLTVCDITTDPAAVK